MVKLLTDEHIARSLIDGLLREEPGLDITRMQDVGLRTKDDPAILAWAAREGRMLITNDANTVSDAAYARVREGLPMPGVIILRSYLSLGQAIEGILLLVGAGFEGEWENQVVYLPL